MSGRRFEVQLAPAWGHILIVKPYKSTGSHRLPGNEDLFCTY